MQKLRLKCTIAGPYLTADEGSIVAVSALNPDAKKAKQLAISLIGGGYAEECRNDNAEEQDEPTAPPPAEHKRNSEEKQNYMSLDEAVLSLDSSNDEHWTKSGLPSMMALEGLTGNKDLSREDVNAAYPDICRQMPDAEAALPQREEKQKHTKGRRSNRP